MASVSILSNGLCIATTHEETCAFPNNYHQGIRPTGTILYPERHIRLF